MDDTINTTLPFYAANLQDPSLMFQTESTPQRSLGNRVFTLNLGATVGGGSVVNGMAVTRGQKNDYNAWEELGNPGWGWEEMRKYFVKVKSSGEYAVRPQRIDLMKSSKLNTPSTEVRDAYGYTFSTGSYGDGPFESVFPAWQWPDTCALPFPTHQPAPQVAL